MNKANDEKDKRVVEEIRKARQEIHIRIENLTKIMDDEGKNLKK